MGTEQSKGGEIIIYSPYRINQRLAELGIKKVEVYMELKNRGIDVQQTDFYQFINGRCRPPRAEPVLEAADKIISEWEAEANGNPQASAGQA